MPINLLKFARNKDDPEKKRTTIFNELIQPIIAELVMDCREAHSMRNDWSVRFR